MRTQIACTPPGNISVDVRQARVSQGGFLQLALEEVFISLFCGCTAEQVCFISACKGHHEFHACSGGLHD